MDTGFDTRAPTVAEVLEREHHQEMINDIRALLKTKEGRRYIWGTIATCRIMHSTFDGGNMYVTAYREGRRSIGLELTEALLEADPDALEALRKEQAKVAEEDAAIIRRAEKGEEDG